MAKTCILMAKTNSIMSVSDAAVGNRAQSDSLIIETLTDARPAPCQSRQTLEIVHNFGLAVHCGPHVHLYNLFAPDARAYEVAGDAESLPLLEMAQCIQLTWKNIFVIFYAFAANFSGCSAISKLLRRSMMQEMQCKGREGCAAPE